MADPSAVAGEDAGGSLATRFRSLLRASASILHGVDPSVTDRWIDDVLARRGGGGGGCGGGDAGDGLGDGGGAGGGGGGSGGDGRAVDDDDSSSDGGLMMLGGLHSDSDSDDDDGLGIGLGMDAGDAGGLHDEDDRDDDDDDDDDEDEDDEEDEVALLKRASSVHSALLLSLPPRLAGGRGAVERLVASISRGGAESRDEEGEPDPSLISLLSFVVSSSSLDERPRGVGRAKWRKVCVANALLAVQFSLRLRKNPRDDEGGSLASSLDGWNAVVLPLLFGAGDGSDDAEASLLLTDDSLRDAALDLVPLSSEVVARGDAERGCRTAASLCLDAAERAVRSRKDAAIGSRLVAAACQVLVRLHDGVSKPRVPRAGDAEVAKEGMHRASLALIRGACYATGDGSVEDRTGNASPTPPLRIEALRPVTGALLPTLYPKKSEVDGMGRVDNGNVNSVADERAIELWEEVLRLVDPEVRSKAGGERRDDVATTAATALLCVLLPSFRDLELPVAVDSNHRRRPAFHPGLWTLLRNCLGRCGDSEVGGGDDFGNGGGGRGTSLLARDTTSGDSGELGAAATDRLLRRRAAHALGLLVERERERLLRKGSGNHVAKGKGKAKGKKKGGKRDESIGVGDRARCRADLWTKYVLAFEVLETETEPHLVEQVWPTVAELAAEAGSVADDEGGAADEETLLPRLTWDDVDALLRRVLFSDSPVLRKLGLYRFLSGGAGVDVVVLPDGAMEADEGTPSDPSGRDAESNEAFMKRPKSKGGIKQTRCGPTSLTEPAPLSTVSVPFVLDAIVRSYDSIVGTKVGGNIQVEGDDGRQQSVALADVLSVFFANYVVALAAQGLGERLSEFANGVFGGLIQNHKARTVTVVWRSVATGLECMPPSERNSLRIDPGTVQGAVRSMRAVFSSGGAPRSMQQGLKLDLARALRNSKPWEKPETSVVLRSLAMYPPSDDDEGPADETRARATLGIWLRGLGSGTWASTAAPACASAFVMGQLVPYGEVDVASGSDVAERESGAAICAMCELCEGGSELLWPAVFKGLQRSVPDDASSPGFFRAHRSAILLEFGCKEGILSGMGNGEIVLDENARSAMPPPPKIEALLGNAVRFVLSQLTTMTTTLFATDDEAGGPSGGSTRSSASSGASSYAAMRIGQMRTLIAAYPSSAVLAEAANRMLEECVDALLLAIRDGLESQTGQERTGNPSDVVKRLVLAYAALSCGAVFEGDSASRIVSTCRAVIGLEPSVPAGIRKGARQACRSIFHYAKWGTLSLIVPMLAEGATALDEEVQSVRQAVLNDARGSVDATPAVALPPLFECALETGRHIVGLDGKTTSLLSSLQTIVETLFAVLEEDSSSSNWLEMLDRTCQLIFREKLLLEEYEPYSKSDRAAMPVRQAFENLLKMAGATKPHIAKAAVSRISSAWLGPEDDVGLCAIPYREHIVDLLVYKECKFDENAAHQARESWDTLPESTNGSSITRAFVLLFLSKLPPLEDMSAVVREELVHFVIRKLMDVCCVQPAQGKAFISGSDEYARFMRAWQALCLLSRYVTKDIAGEVAARAFSAMTWNLHGQLRYFIEVFVIQCTRIHPSIFGAVYIREIRRNDLSLQHVSSLMIIGGNLTVGRYSNEFFRSPADPKIKDIVCGVLPWLSSTQGFSRAIAQLLCHKLIPLVVDVEADAPTGSGVNDDSVLRSVYSFLEDNADMSRLRKKQQLFFESYDVDSVCSFEGLLRIPVDEGEEANPLHMVDSIKDCLAEVYKEAHDEDAPIWKQMEDLLIEADAARQSESPDDDGLEGDQDGSQLVNFQRKILPIDLLDLGLKSFQQQKLLNAAGKRKQSLVVCASLIDKVPNLAGLARTCEIFSARLLVLPNLLIRKQDDFKSISASANDWIDMIECKEEDLMPWLQEKKSEGYSVIGLEQTASSKCLTKMDFPDKTVLLLGKEKEGIPIEFLSAVDQCVEIPQLGIIRSLNVHVSGAITIWEYTKQMMQKKKARKAR